MLGVTEFGVVYCWGYVEPRRLRVELLFPLNVLETMFQIPSENAEYLTTEELEAARQKIVAYFQNGNPVSVDQQVIQPQVTKVDFFPANQRDFAIQSEIDKLSFANGRVGITIHYPYQEVPQSIELEWDKFSRALNNVQAYLYYQDSVVGENFSRQVSDNRISWTNPGNWTEPKPVQAIAFRSDQVASSGVDRKYLTWLTGGLAAMVILLTRGRGRTVQGIALVSVMVLFSVVVVLFPAQTKTQIKADAGKEIPAENVQHLYQAFEFADEENIYDQLAQSVSGPQLRELYLQLLEGLTAQEQGGAVSSIESVQVLDVTLPEDTQLDPSAVSELLPPEANTQAAFQCQVSWSLKGLVEHWGHSHERTNKYVATAWYAAVNDEWKMIKLIVQDQDPGLTKPRPRKFSRTDAPAS